MATDRKKAAIDATAAENHLRVLLRGMRQAGGFLELRTFPEKEKGVGYPGTKFVPVDADDRQIAEAVAWLERESSKGNGVFVGVNPRSEESGTKGSVKRMTTAFLDLDLDKRGIDREDALAEIQEISPIPPDLITDSGGGLHVLYFNKPTDDYEKWRALQETLYEKFEHLGADRSVVTDSSRILRLTPFPNWKYEKESGGRGTRIVSFTARDFIPSIDTASEMFEVRPGAGQRKGDGKLPESIPEGGAVGGEGRNNMLFKEASRLRDRGYTADEIYAAISALNERRAVPPLPDSEVRGIAESASRYEPTRDVSGGGFADLIGAPERGRVGYKFSEFIRTPFPELVPVIHGLHSGELGMINAVPNVGKTTMGLGLAMSLATGREFHPLYAGGAPRKVMYLDFENRASFLQKDVLTMSGLNFDESERGMIGENLFISVDQEIYGSALTLSNPDHLEFVTREAVHHAAELIIIDTMAAAFQLANENDNSEAEKVVIKPLKELAKKTGAAILVVHHVGKAGETGDRSKLYAGRGASAFAAAARMVLLLEHLKDGSGKRVDNHVVLSQPKIKGKPFEDTVFELDFPRRWFEPADVVLPDDAATQELIWSVITRPMKRIEVIALLREMGKDISDSTVDRALRLGLKTGRLLRGDVAGQYVPRPAEDGLTLEFDGGDILDADTIGDGGDEE